jgi:signal transduction histidine kinase
MLARLDPDSVESIHHAAPLTEAVTQAVTDKRAAASLKSLTVSMNVPEEDPCVVTVDPSALSLLIGNLLENAIKYTPEGGAVRLLVAPRGDRTLLQVTDTGPGVPSLDRSRVLERFYRRSRASAPGSGLGLSIVQRICELYGAKLELLDGDDGKGLCVEVTFASAA